MGLEETLLQKVKQQEERTRDMAADIKDIRKKLFGNGDVGLAESVRLNTRFREDIKKLIWAFVTVFVGQLAVIVVTLLK